MIYFLCKTDENVIQEMFGICQLNCLPLANMPLPRDIKKRAVVSLFVVTILKVRHHFNRYSVQIQKS